MGTRRRTGGRAAMRPKRRRCLDELQQPFSSQRRQKARKRGTRGSRRKDGQVRMGKLQRERSQGEAVGLGNKQRTRAKERRGGGRRGAKGGRERRGRTEIRNVNREITGGLPSLLTFG